DRDLGDIQAGGRIPAIRQLDLGVGQIGGPGGNVDRGDPQELALLYDQVLAGAGISGERKIAVDVGLGEIDVTSELDTLGTVDAVGDALGLLVAHIDHRADHRDRAIGREYGAGQGRVVAPVTTTTSAAIGG